jgi:hypothetical protein
MKVTKRTILTGALVLAMALPVAAFAGSNRGQNAGNRQQSQQRSFQQFQQRQRLRDGSCLDSVRRNSGAMEKKGDTYGPGDGTGNAGTGPKDGMGYGAPGNR